MSKKKILRVGESGPVLSAAVAINNHLKSQHFIKLSSNAIKHIVSY